MRAAVGAATPRSGPATDEAQWLGWLGIVDDQLAHAGRAQSVRRTRCRAQGFHARRCCSAWAAQPRPRGAGADVRPASPGFPELHVLDSTDPAQIQALRRRIDLAQHAVHRLQQVRHARSSPNIFKQYFFERVKQAVGAARPGGTSSPITDPGSKLQQVAEGRRLPARLLRRAEHRRPLLGAVQFRHGAGGGRWASTLRRFLDRAAMMVARLRRRRAAGGEPGRACSGAILGERGAAGPRQGDDHRLAGHRATSAPGWSSCSPSRPASRARASIPVDGEPLGAPDGLRRTTGCSSTCGSRRRRSRRRTRRSTRWRRPASRWSASRSPTPTSSARSSSAGRSRPRWPASVIGINPFDQPDVEASKVATRKLTDAYEQTGALPAETPFFEADGIALFADGGTRRRSQRPARTGRSRRI